MTLSIQELSRLYYGEQPLITQSPERLTPSAKYLVQVARKKLAGNRLRLTEPELFSFLKSVETEEGELLSERERTAAVSVLSQSFEDFGVLTPLIDDPSVNDIIVKRFDDISVQRGRVNYQTGLSFGDREGYNAFVEQLLKRAGKACTVATPIVDAALGQNIRLCVTHESLSPADSGPLLTIRVARYQSITLQKLIQSELGSKELLTYLGALVSSGECTMLISGEVGTGKTTLIRALSGEIPEAEAVLIIEDTEEIRLNRPFTRTLLTREANTEGNGRVSPAQAIRAGMRMAMNRVILGEMRDAEAAESFIDVCASGHPGMSTIHARSARDSLSRLELFLSRAQPGVGMETIRRQISDAISVVVYLGVDPESGARKILEVAELGSAADGQIQLSPTFTWCRKERSWRLGISRFNDLLKGVM